MKGNYGIKKLYGGAGRGYGGGGRICHLINIRNHAAQLVRTWKNTVQKSW